MDFIYLLHLMEQPVNPRDLQADLKGVLGAELPQEIGINPSFAACRVNTL